MKHLASSALLDCNCIVELEVNSVVELPQAGKEVEHYCPKACKMSTNKVIKASSAYWILDDVKEEVLPEQTTFLEGEKDNATN
jgi:inorganic triphosphatase YgiF